MKEYFISIIAVALVGSMLASLTQSGSLAKNVRLLCALCTVACIIFPLGTIFETVIDAEGIQELFDLQIEDDKNYDEIYNCAINDSQILNAEMSLKSEIIQALSIDNDSFDLKIVSDKESDVFCILYVCVYIHPSGVSIDPRRIEGYVSERLGCECEFVYDVL